MRYCDKKAAEDSTGAEYADCRIMGTFEKTVPSPPDGKDKMLTISGVCPREQLESFLEYGAIRQWTELVVPEVLCIPGVKPDIEQLISISAAVEIICQRVIKTPYKTASGKRPVPLFNYEGTAITGKKLIMEGVVRQKIVYAAAQAHSVHAVHFDTPFSAFIVLSPQDSLARNLKTAVCIEDIFITDITRRKIFKNITLIVRAVPSSVK